MQAAGYPVFGPLDKHVPPVFQGTRNVLGVMISVERLMIIPIAGVLVVGLYLFINKTRMGAAMRAIEQDKEAAALQGVERATWSMASPSPSALRWRPRPGR